MLKMIFNNCVGNNYLLLLFAIVGSCECKRRWTYEFLDVKGYSEDETKVKPDLRVERVGRHQIGISGTLDLQYDIDETTMSPSGSIRDLRKLPLALPKQVFINMKSAYDDNALNNLINCTNLPHFEGDLLLPWPRNLYTFDMCRGDYGNAPEILAEGLYKSVMEFSGEVVWNVTFFVILKTQLI